MSSSYKLREEFAKYLINKIVNQGKGASEDGEYCLFERPRDTYFIGCLKPAPEDFHTNKEDLEQGGDFSAKLAPYAIGCEFLLETMGDYEPEITIFPQFSTYYRIIPEYDWQQDVEGIDTLVPAFKRFTPEFKGIKVKLTELVGNKKVFDSTNDKIVYVLKQIEEAAASDPKTLKTIVKSKTLNTKDGFQNAISKALSGNGPEFDWNFELHIIVKKEAKQGLLLVKVFLVNSGNPKDDESRLKDNFLFDVSLRIETANSSVRPFDFLALPESYRYDRRMWGIGLNCNILHDGNILTTETAPKWKQKRLVPRKKVGDKKLPNLKFKTFTETPIPLLEELKNSMNSYLNHCRINKAKFLKGTDPQVTPKEEFEYDQGIKKFEEEIFRFSRGIEILANPKYKIILESFQYLNETMQLISEQSKEKYESWRPFQLVFIVSQIPCLAAYQWLEIKERDSIESVDVIYFPTGGGKTEAYLGLVILNLFFDRLRGKNVGLTSLLRFPLRLLTLQQFQRAFNLIAYAEIIKSKHGIPGEPFSLGFLVGGDQTPNNIDTEYASKLSTDPKLRHKFRKVRTCPFCLQEAVSVEWDEETWSLYHICNNDTCVSRKIYLNKRLPLYVIDYELYRRLPSVIISTIDKVANIGAQVRFTNLFGQVKSYCNKHGFSWNDKCDLNGCSEKTEKVTNSLLLSPTIEIQDELHLLKEDLGAFDSHYETFLVELLKQYSGLPWKTICSTATVRDFENHVRHLYARDGHPVQFPVPGPTWQESFYAVTEEDAGRYFVGILPNNKTHINATVELLWFFHKEIQNLRRLSLRDFNDKTGLIITSQEEKDNLLDDYEVSLTYVLTKRGGDQIAESIGSQVNQYLTKRDDLKEIKNRMMTGGTSGADVEQIMNEIEKKYKVQSPIERIRSVTATSMISHGVDISRFNYMLFFGMPRQTAEYIQASSRVGRSLPGISFICFSPSRERDRSHYHFFFKYHEYLERLVEPPAINRWSKFSIEKTIPGIFSGYILNHYSRKFKDNLYMSSKVKKYIGKIDSDIKEITAFLERVYRCDQPQASWFKIRVPNAVIGFLNDISDRMRSTRFPEALGAMKSLRDTEEPISFKADFNTSKALDNLE